MTWPGAGTGSFAYRVLRPERRCIHKYTSWDKHGSLICWPYALPLKSLYMTGKKAVLSSGLERKGSGGGHCRGRITVLQPKDTCYDGRTPDSCMAGCRNWSPAVRKRSAQALGRREGDFVPSLLKLLAGEIATARYGRL